MQQLQSRCDAQQGQLAAARTDVAALQQAMEEKTKQVCVCAMEGDGATRGLLAVV